MVFLLFPQVLFQLDCSIILFVSQRFGNESELIGLSAEFVSHLFDGEVFGETGEVELVFGGVLLRREELVRRQKVLFEFGRFGFTLFFDFANGLDLGGEVFLVDNVLEPVQQPLHKQPNICKVTVEKLKLHKLTFDKSVLNLAQVCMLRGVFLLFFGSDVQEVKQILKYGLVGCVSLDGISDQHGFQLIPVLFFLHLTVVLGHQPHKVLLSEVFPHAVKSCRR